MDSPPPPPGAGGGPPDAGPKTPGPGGDTGAIRAPDGGMKPPRGEMMMRISPQGFTLQARGETMAALAKMIANHLGSTVVDKTGLKGEYDCTLQFAPEGGTGPMALPPGAPPPGGGDAPPPQGPSLFTALQEQLGLKLEAHKEPVDVVVIDHIEQPSPNYPQAGVNACCVGALPWFRLSAFCCGFALRGRLRRLQPITAR